MADEAPSFQFEGDPDLSGAIQQALAAARTAGSDDGTVAAIGLALLAFIATQINNSASSAGPVYPSAPADDGRVMLGPGVSIKDDRITANGMTYSPDHVQDQAVREQVLMIVARLQNERLAGIAQRIRQWYGL